MTGRPDDREERNVDRLLRLAMVLAIASVVLTVSSLILRVLDI